MQTFKSEIGLDYIVSFINIIPSIKKVHAMFEHLNRTCYIHILNIGVELYFNANMN